MSFVKVLGKLVIRNFNCLWTAYKTLRLPCSCKLTSDASYFLLDMFSKIVIGKKKIEHVFYGPLKQMIMFINPLCSCFSNTVTIKGKKISFYALFIDQPNRVAHITHLLLVTSVAGSLQRCWAATRRHGSQQLWRRQWWLALQCGNWGNRRWQGWWRGDRAGAHRGGTHWGLCLLHAWPAWAQLHYW